MRIETANALQESLSTWPNRMERMSQNAVAEIAQVAPIRFDEFARDYAAAFSIS